MVFAYPVFFYLLLIIPLMIAWYVWKGKRHTAPLKLPGFENISDRIGSARIWLRHLLFVIRITAILLLIIVLARPQSANQWETVSSEGVDIIMCLDVSGSMRAMDFKPNRLEAAKDVGIGFVNGRPDDRFGLVVFSGESFTQCPLTTDRAVVTNFLKGVDFGMIEDGTAIGMGLATSINRLKESKAEGKVIILLTDGVNNMGDIGPVTAAEIAAQFGVRIYTIGVGSRGEAPFPVQDFYGRTLTRNMPVEIDEEVLKEVAVKTGGAYFRATDNNTLREIYRQIDQLEKTKMEVKQFSKKKEEYFPFLLSAMLLLILELLLRYTWFRTIP
ncbi:MAG TPA: VWA domain-containing protein [Bacteroidaceae bacterium]|nr:VWA domain-containing protein [Bacteroidaceae bacterium]